MGIPSCAAVVGTKDRGDKIAALLQSIVENTVQDFELVIVDQSSGDETELAVAPFRSDQRITYIRSDEVGVSRARNLAIRNTTAPFIAIVDDDCIVPTDWFHKIIEPFDRDSRIGVVFCSVQPVPVPVSKVGHTPSIVIERNQTVTNVREAWSNARHGMNLGAGMAVRRAAFEDVGGFDEVLGPGSKFGAAEDNDLSWRCLLKGWATFRTADVTVMHDGFRDLDELRELVVRDFYGVGGTIAKYLRTGNLWVSILLVDWLVRFGLVGPFRELMAGRRPSGLRRPFMMMRGLGAGFNTPFDGLTVKYQAD